MPSRLKRDPGNDYRTAGDHFEASVRQVFATVHPEKVFGLVIVQEVQGPVTEEMRESVEVQMLGGHVVWGRRPQELAERLTQHLLDRFDSSPPWEQEPAIEWGTASIR